MTKIVRDMLTGIDGSTFDFARVGGVAGMLAFILLEAYSVVVKGGAFDMQAFGIGFASLIAGAGAAVGMKAKCEPQGGPQ